MGAFLRRIDLRCGQGGNIVVSQLAGPGSIPGRDNIPGWGFSRGFPQP